MKPLRFTWDPNKAASNLHKHGVSFTEAQTVFYDENALEFYDDEHAEWDTVFIAGPQYHTALADCLPLLSRE